MWLVCPAGAGFVMGARVRASGFARLSLFNDKGIVALLQLPIAQETVRGGRGLGSRREFKSCKMEVTSPPKPEPRFPKCSVAG